MRERDCGIRMVITAFAWLSQNVLAHKVTLGTPRINCDLAVYGDRRYVGNRSHQVRDYC